MKKIRYYLKEIAIFSLILFLFANIISLYKSSSLNKNKLSIQNVTLLDGTTYKFSNDEPTLIHIWATWCPTCKLEASNIQYLSKHFNVLSIAVKSGSNNEIQQWMESNNYTFAVVNDSSGFIASEFEVQAFPTTFIYDKHKNLVFADVGYSSILSLYIKLLWSDLKE